jgi:poly-gamma-glutamate capsule biosynthesis protein CapA/YwtB (metallophosphatase superfamily)
VANTCTLFLCGDVMTGRGVDQILPHPSRPELSEPVVGSALEYVALAEEVHGPIPRATDSAYVWGDALGELERRAPDARIINLETSVTTSARPEPKGINYRMHPANIGVLSVAGIDCAVLANNHVLDWGPPGLLETLDTLAGAGIRVVGAGRTLDEAESPAIIDIGEHQRIVLVAIACADGGTPSSWSAQEGRPGVHWIGDYTEGTTAHVADLIKATTQEGDIVILSLHWGTNWGYEIPDDHRRFAHRLIEDAGVDLVYGHSSHHVKAIEVYRERLILYGCGDFLNDYEGIGSPHDFRDDLTLMYFPTLDLRSGALTALAMVPLVIRHFRLQRPSTEDARWLRDTLDRECRRFGARVEERDGCSALVWH